MYMFPKCAASMVGEMKSKSKSKSIRLPYAMRIMDNSKPIEFHPQSSRTTLKTSQYMTSFVCNRSVLSRLCMQVSKESMSAHLAQGSFSGGFGVTAPMSRLCRISPFSRMTNQPPCLLYDPRLQAVHYAMLTAYRVLVQLRSAQNRGLYPSSKLFVSQSQT